MTRNFSAKPRGRPLVIAHRGACRLAPENTLAAFMAAADLGADAIELDAKLTADGEVVVHHDLTLERTTSGRGRLSQHSLAELKTLDAGSHFGAGFTGERIPRLRSVFENLGHRLLINVELTNYENPRDSLAAAVVGLVREYGLERRVLLSSFNPLALRAARARAPEIGRALLVEAGQSGVLRWFYRRISPAHAFHPQDSLVRRANLDVEHALGRAVHVWTVNDVRRMTELTLWGVDGLITDVPDVALRVVNGQPA
jgi:glycerophosphoryl diester phosphodiesterase